MNGRFRRAKSVAQNDLWDRARRRVRRARIFPQAAEKWFLPSGNRPENREIFRFPQFSSRSMKILGFSSKA